MGDRSSFQATVYDVPSRNIQALLDEVESYGLNVDWSEAPPKNGERFIDIIGKDGEITFTCEEINLGMEEEFGKFLIGLEAVFDCWQDPKYEWLGRGVMNHPEIGSFEYECGSDGEPMIAMHRVDAALTTGSIETVRELLGTEYRKRFKELTKVPLAST